MKGSSFFYSNKSSNKFRLRELLNKDIKELNGIILSLFCISFLLTIGLISYKVNSSYAIFTDTINGEKTIEITVYFPTAVETLISKVGESGLSEITHPADSTLQIGATESMTEYRFRGNNSVVTNNYVYFNCSDISNQTSSTCELYRIIGVFPVDDGTGKIENRVKLIKATAYNGTHYYNNVEKNNWAAPTSLNTTLNTTYWGSIRTNYQALVGNSKYYLGGYNNNLAVRTSVMYGYERKISGSTYYYSGNATNWTGKIAIMYVTDYGYAANSACSESTNLYDYETNSCPSNNWLHLGSVEWVLTHLSSSSKNAFVATSYGYVFGTSDGSVIYNAAVRPVFYLTADARFVTGDGSSVDPYQLLE